MEMIIVVFILSLLAAMIVPNVANQQQGLQRREFFSALSRFCVNAREDAISEKKTLKLTLDSSRNAFVVSEVNDDGDQERSSLNLAKGMETQDFTTNGESSNSAEWEVTFNSDGTSSGGGIELDDGGRIRSLQVKPDGSISLDDGPAEQEPAEDKWPAGETEKRA
jgi:type II secretory pathway pseudopilin PulG